MTESSSAAPEQGATKAPKDKNCPYCGQAFTSSSLGRHLDLYIKEKNPKAPDGVHDVDAIRRLRGGITRRQPRNSLRRDTATPTGTPATASARSPSDAGSGCVRSPTLHRDGSQSAGPSVTRSFPFTPGWEVTGVINDIPSKGGDGSKGGNVEAGQDAAAKRPAPTRTMSRQMVKAQFDMKQKFQDALDTARAAELALREIMSSWRAAKQHFDMQSTPFDFEPLSLDFPALCLQCLKPPPTLFSSTQHPTPTSWSIGSPGQREYEALQAYFRDEFHKWKITCAAATTAAHEDVTYPPIDTVQYDVKEAVRRAEQLAEDLEKQVNDHLQSAFNVWGALSPQRRQELWVLELARSVGRKQKEVDKLREEQGPMKQEIANLKTQVEHLNRLQQPREFKLMTPSTLPITNDFLQHMQEQTLKDRRGVGLSLEDRHHDLNTIVTSAIDRWKAVVVSTRAAGGMNQQRPLEPPSTPAPNTAPTPSVQLAQQLAQQARPSRRGAPAPAPTPPQAPPQPAGSTASSSSAPAPTATDENTTSAAPTPVAPTAAESTPAPPSPAARSEDDEMSDQDADAEMEDDDGFPAMNTPATSTPVASTPVAKPTQPAPAPAPAPAPVPAQPPEQSPQPQVPEQQPPQLQVSRTRGPPPGRGGRGGPRLGVITGQRSASHAGHGRRGGIRGGIQGVSPEAMRHVTHNIVQQVQQQQQQQQQRQQEQQQMQDVDVMPGTSQGDPMYMD